MKTKTYGDWHSVSGDGLSYYGISALVQPLTSGFSNGKAGDASCSCIVECHKGRKGTKQEELSGEYPMPRLKLSSVLHIIHSCMARNIRFWFFYAYIHGIKRELFFDAFIFPHKTRLTKHRCVIISEDPLYNEGWRRVWQMDVDCLDAGEFHVSDANTSFSSWNLNTFELWIIQKYTEVAADAGVQLVKWRGTTFSFLDAISCREIFITCSATVIESCGVRHWEWT